MDTLLLAYSKLKEIALFPWFAIGNTRVSLLTVFGLVVILVIVWRVGIVIEQTIAKIGSSQKKEFSQGWQTLSRISRYVIWIIGLILALGYLGFSMGSFAMIGGAIGVGLGFGLQNVISNLVAGIIILIEKIIKVGDFVDLQSGVMGKVTEINLRYTRVTTTDLIDIIVPNSEFTSGRVVNWTLGERERRLHVPFSVAYGSDKQQGERSCHRGSFERFRNREFPGTRAGCMVGQVRRKQPGLRVGGLGWSGFDRIVR